MSLKSLIERNDHQDVRLLTDIESKCQLPLDRRIFTVCSGVDFINITYTSFLAPSEAEANVSRDCYSSYYFFVLFFENLEKFDSTKYLKHKH